MQFALSTGLRQSPAYQKSARDSIQQTGCQLCLRLFRHDFRQSNLESAIQTFLSEIGLRAADVHLVLDFQAMAEDPPIIKSWIDRLPWRDEWMTLVVVCGAFPKNLAHLEKNSQHLIPRSDFSCWRDYVHEASGRIAAFGDYTIQHGVFEESEGKQLNFSASLRYTGLTNWLIMRGEGVRNEDGPGYTQWVAHAQLLCEMDEFWGEDFSFGDKYVKEMSEEMQKTGRGSDWLAATINHHLTLTARQISRPSELSGLHVSSL